MSGSTNWKRRAADLIEQLAAVRAKLKASRSRQAALAARLHRYERLALDPAVLEQLLPARAEAMQRRAIDHATKAREAMHAAASPAYEAAIADGLRVPDGTEHVCVAGVNLWVPVDRRLPGRLADHLLTRRQLPLATILQTREAVGGGVMLDIGANVGTTSLPRAVLGDYAAIWAAEPDPSNFACLVRGVVRNGLRGVVLPDHCAISNRNGVGRLQLSRSIGGHRLTDDAGGMEVPTWTLETWVRRLHIELELLRFVKVDTQGHEVHVLEGAGGLLERRGVVWQLEVSPKHLTLAGRSLRDLIAKLQTFSAFVDLYGDAPGARVRPMTELPEALGYLEGGSFTDILVYRA